MTGHDQTSRTTGHPRLSTRVQWAWRFQAAWQSAQLAKSEVGERRFSPFDSTLAAVQAEIRLEVQPPTMPLADTWSHAVYMQSDEITCDTREALTQLRLRTHGWGNTTCGC